MAAQSSVPDLWPFASIFSLAPCVSRSMYSLTGSLSQQQITGRCAKSHMHWQHGHGEIDHFSPRPLLADLNLSLFIPSFTPSVRIPLAALCPSRQPSGCHHSFFQSYSSLSEAECFSDGQAMIEDKKMRKFLGGSSYKNIKCYTQSYHWVMKAFHSVRIRNLKKEFIL